MKNKIETLVDELEKMRKFCFMQKESFRARVYNSGKDKADVYESIVNELDLILDAYKNPE